MLETMKMAETVAEKRISQTDRKESAYRRSNKPLMEKKRRARINSCLTQLKTLVLQAMRKDTNQYSKLEKADILEMTVKHLRQLQRQQISAAMTHDPTVATKYRAGFNECANEVARYLGSVQGVNGEVRSRLLNHLGNVVTSVNNQCPQEPQNISQPLNVQIPQHLNQPTVASVPSGCLLMTTGVAASPLVQQQHTVSPQGHSQNVSPVQQPQQQQTGTEFCGSFQIIPHSSAPGAVAVYLGKTQTVSPQEQTKGALPVYSARTPPRTKASLKAFDSSAFSQVPPQSHSQTESHSPSDCIGSFSDHPDFHINGIPVGCGRTPSPLKIENVWRPW